MTILASGASIYSPLLQHTASHTQPQTHTDRLVDHTGKLCLARSFSAHNTHSQFDQARQPQLSTNGHRRGKLALFQFDDPILILISANVRPNRSSDSIGSRIACAAADPMDHC
jgi:hypothetical protein